MPTTHRSFAMIEPPAGSGTLAATPEQNKHSATFSVSPKSQPLDIGERYELQGIIAKGGMGEVHSAWDHVLKRSVAVKLLHDKLATDLIIKRFHYEAYITGQLQHPSIPPVHDLGTTADGKPYLVMKLIKGRTLEDLIKQPGEEKLNVLAIFEAIAQAIGYAHSRAVIHRDLKPLNVMVGAFGEVQVMDWGLAKFRSDSEATTPEASIVSTFYDPRTADDSHTSAGAIMGTPSYMPPEQAIGAIDRVNERSDVFGLGGILCAMLTGQPVFVVVDAESTRQLAANGRVVAAFARLDACGAEPEVLALAKQCLAVEPSERPANGYEVAKIVAKLRRDADERAKQAEIGKARSDTRRRVLTWSAIAVFAVLSAGVIASLLFAKRATDAEYVTSQQLVKTQDAERATSQQLELTQAAEAAANAKTKEVEATLVVVGQRTKMLGDAYGDFVFDIQNMLVNRPGTQDLRRALLEKARTGLKKILDEARKQGSPDQTLAWSHFRMGDVEQQLGNTLAAQKEYQAGYELAKQLADVDPKNADAQRDLSVIFNRLGDVTRRLGQTKDALDFFQKGLVVSQRLADADPKNAMIQHDLSVSFDRLGDVTRRLGQTKDALDFFQKGQVVSQRLADADPKNAVAQRDLSVNFNKLGDVTRQLGQTKDALDFYQKGLVVRQRLADADPKNADAQRDLSISFNNLGDVTLQLGQTEAALDFYHKYNVICQRLADADPKNAEAQRDLGISFNRLGNVTRELGQTEAALDFYHKYNVICQRLADADPKNAMIQHDLGVSFNRLGDVTRRLGQTKDALDFYQKGLVVSQRLADADPKNADAQTDLFVCYYKLGVGEMTAHEYARALIGFVKAQQMIKDFHIKGWITKPEEQLGTWSVREWQTDIEQQLAICRKADKALADLDFALKQPAVEVPGLLDIRVQVFAKKSDLKNLLATAIAYEKLATTDDRQLYNAACAWSQASGLAKDDAKRKEEYASKALTLLRKTPTGKGHFFDLPAKLAAQMKRDSDMNPLRERADFQKRIADLEAPPKPREHAPPPRAK